MYYLFVLKNNKQELSCRTLWYSTERTSTVVHNNQKILTGMHTLLTICISSFLVILFVFSSLTNSYAQEYHTVTTDELIDFFSPSEEKIKHELGQSGSGKTRGIVDIPEGHSKKSRKKSSYRYEPQYIPQQNSPRTNQKKSRKPLQQSPQPESNKTEPEARKSFQNILFDVNSHTIKKSSYKQLDEIGKALKIIMSRHQDFLFVIEGHTDSIGNADYNKTLSKQRAQAVRGFLVSKYGLDKKRIRSVGYGETKPVESNDNKHGRSMNRRVEIVRR